MSYSYKRPYLYKDYDRTRNTVMEREKFDPNRPERVESQFKKPYLYAEHPQSEQELAEPGGGFYPPPPGPNPGWDCRPGANAVGGGTPDHCNPEVECGVWDFTCCHKITSFSAIGGIIQSVQQGMNDTCRVVACWNEADGKLSVIGTVRDTGAMVGADLDKGLCLGEGHDPGCINCVDCVGANHIPTITYASQNLNLGSMMVLTASGGAGGPYHWRITSGLGTLSGGVGMSVTYTAPSANPNCVNNPTIEVEDFCGNVKTVTLAVTNFADQYAAGLHFFLAENGDMTWVEYCNCAGACGGGGVAGPCFCCGFPTQADCPDACGAPATTGCVPCNDAAGGHDCSPRYVDIRTEAQLTAGCCPAYFLP